MRIVSRGPLLAVVLLALARPCLTAQVASPEDLERRARQALEAGETERGVELLRQALAALATTGPSPVRVRIELQLAAASWGLGRYDSATVHFQEAVRLDPTARLDPEASSAELTAAFEVARRTTPAIGLQVPLDDTLTLRDSLPVTISLTQPGQVRLRLSSLAGQARDTVVFTGRLDGTTPVPVALRDAAGRPLASGRYRLIAEYSGPGVPLPLVHSVQLELSQQGSDSLDHEPPPADSLFRAEFTKGAGPRSSIWRGLAFGLAAAMIPVMLGSGDLSDGVDGGAVAVGVAVGAAGVAGYYLGRPKIAIPENVDYNESLRAAWRSRDRAIAEENAVRREQILLLRVRLVPGL